MKQQLTIAIDPGWNTGIAFFVDDDYIDCHEFHLTEKNKKSFPLVEERLQFLGDKLKEAINNFFKMNDTTREEWLDEGNTLHFVIEKVCLWGASAKSLSAAMSGHLFNLSYLVGRYTSIVNDSFDSKVKLVFVQEWKGNLSTELLIPKMQRKSGTKVKNEHIACAMGIGFNYLGLF